MDIIFSEIVFISIGLLIGTIAYIALKKQIKIGIYKYIAYILLASIALWFGVFSFSYCLEKGDSLYFFLTFVFIYIAVCIISMRYILKKYFQCTSWFPHLLFTTFAVSIYYIPILLGLLLAVLIFSPS